jgi:hypothetical protein
MVMSLDIPTMDDGRSQLSEWIETARSNPIPAALLAVTLGWIGIQTGAPTILTTALLGLGYGVIPSYLGGRFIVRKTFPDTRLVVDELNLSDESDSITSRTWKIPVDVWANRSRGDRPALEPDHGNDKLVTSVEIMQDLGRISVEGVNEELSNPASIVSRDQQLKEIEDNLLEKGEQLDKLEASFRSKSLEIQRENVHSLLAAVETGTQMDPGAVERALEGVDLDLDAKVHNRHEQNGQQNGQQNGHSETVDRIDTDSTRQQATLGGGGGNWKND